MILIINRIINRIKNNFYIQKLFKTLGFINIKFFYNNFNIKLATININPTTDKSYIIKQLNIINTNFNQINFTFKLIDRDAFNPIFYKYKQRCIQCEAQKQYTNEIYYLSSHICQLYRPDNKLYEPFINNIENIQFYIKYPFLWIINCYQEINNKYKYINTKYMFLTENEHNYTVISTFNLVKYFNLQII